MIRTVRSGLVGYRCTAAGHVRAAGGVERDTLTVLEGEWAFCPFDVRESGHRWESTGGVTLQALRAGQLMDLLVINGRGAG